MYNILEAKIEFKEGKLHRVVVLVEMSKGDIRAIEASTKPRAGYMYLLPHHKLNDELLQEVAGGGGEISKKIDFTWDSRKDEWI